MQDDRYEPPRRMCSGFETSLTEQGQSDAADAAAQHLAGEMIEIRHAEQPDAAERRAIQEERAGTAQPAAAAPARRGARAPLADDEIPF